MTRTVTTRAQESALARPADERRMFETLREDWKTYDGDLWRQGLWVMWVYRFGQWRYRVRPALQRKPLSLLYKVMRTGCQMLTGIELPCETWVGRRLRIEHFGAACPVRAVGRFMEKPEEGSA